MKHKQEKPQTQLPTLAPLTHNANDREAYKRLAAVLAGYEAALAEFPTQAAEDAAQRVACVLSARQTVAAVIAEASHLAPDLLQKLVALDQQLKGNAATCVAVVGATTLADWRAAVRAASADWWWSLEELATPKPNPAWTLFALLLLAGAAALSAEIARRFLSSGGADLTALGIPLLQAALTFLAGSTLTQTGQEWMETRLAQRGVARRHYPAYKTLVPLLVLLIIGGFYLALPTFARFYARNYLGRQAFEWQAAGKLDEAAKHYERAISLDPDFAPAHYNLGSVYEQWGDYDKAITAYQTALRLQPDFTLAHNNLARLMILRRNDPATALRLLDTALALKPPPAVSYVLHKNRGWARWQLKSYGLAAEDFCAALSLRADGAAAYCLLAQLLETADAEAARQLCPAARAGVLKAWENCEAYRAGQEHELEASWLSLAQERLRQEGTK